MLTRLLVASKTKRQDLFSRRPTWAEIDLDALAANFHLIKRHVGAAINVMAVVKANAYGHGAVACAQRLAAEGADWFGVALPEEGIELRESGISQPILCLGGFWEGQAEACVKYRLTPVVYRLDMMEALDRAARAAGVFVDVHLKIDTGMGRLGFRFDELDDAPAILKGFENLRVDGLMTHFAAADDPACEQLTEDQIARFASAASTFHQAGHQPTFMHSANSAAIYSHSDSWCNMIRPGGVLYGLWRDVLPAAVDAAELQPVMSLYSQISLLKWVPAGETIGYGCTFEASRKTLVATIPIGYDDGYPRALSNRAHVLVRGVCASVVGRISMDLTLVDVTGVPGVEVGDPVLLLGRDETARLSITAEELAKISGTLSYEITCGIGKRVPRLVRSNTAVPPGVQ
ncbi:MAG TPA: alanine racemase [Pyrinomonadaceae bacterium]|nr:alanine racemase [Pyrinomonadaceae bacterium]